MGSKSFSTLSAKECLDNYSSVLKNSESKWKAAELLAEHGDYGSALSFAIISIEELVKAIILVFDGKGFNFRNVKGMHIMFSQHKIRYFISYLLFAIGIIGDEFEKLFLNLYKNPDFYKVNFSDMMSSPGFNLKVKYYFLKKFILFQKEFEYFSKLDSFRKDGFYCDYDEQLIHPIQIKEEDFKELHVRLEKVIKVGNLIINSIEKYNSVNESKEIDLFKKMMLDQDYYQKIGESLFKIRTSKQNLFEYVKSECLMLK